MNKQRLHSVFTLTVNLVFTLALLSKSLHFLLVPHEFNFHYQEDISVYSPKIEIHFCDLQIIKTSIKPSDEIIISSVFEKITQKKSIAFPERELAEDIKQSFRLRGPPIFFYKYQHLI